MISGLLRPIRQRLSVRFPRGAGISKEEDFRTSKSYWQDRYSSGGNSGAGSYGTLAKYKADFISKFLLSHNIDSVIEFGCGDGNQISLISYKQYLGLDVSDYAIEICRQKFLQFKYYHFDNIGSYKGQKVFGLGLSLDVIYHLVEDEVFEKYMLDLFSSASRYVLIYSSNFDAVGNAHVRHRQFTNWVATHKPEFKLISYEENPFSLSGRIRKRQPISSANFYIFQRL